MSFFFFSFAAVLVLCLIRGGARAKQAAGEGSARLAWLDIPTEGFAAFDAVVAAVESAALTVAFLAMVGLYFGHMLDGTQVWQSKLPIYLMLWVGFLGASLATRKNKHLSVQAVSKLAPTKWKPLFRIVSGCVAATVSLCLAFLGWGYTVQTYNLRNTERLIPIPLDVVVAMDSVPRALERPVSAASAFASEFLSIEGDDGKERALVDFPEYDLRPSDSLQARSWDSWTEKAELFPAFTWFSDESGPDGDRQIRLAGLPIWLVESIMPLALLVMGLRFLLRESIGTIISVAQRGWEATGKAFETVSLPAAMEGDTAAREAEPLSAGREPVTDAGSHVPKEPVTDAGSHVSRACPREEPEGTSAEEAGAETANTPAEQNGQGRVDPLEQEEEL